MAKLRKMLGKIDSPECMAMMRQIETQSKKTLAVWALLYAKNRYLPICKEQTSVGTRMAEMIQYCEDCLEGKIAQKECKVFLKEAAQLARDAVENPAGQAAARAIAVACAVMQTPTNSLGFLFYGAAAVAYSQAGISAECQIYNEIATQEFIEALESLKKLSVKDEQNPVKINWNC